MLPMATEYFAKTFAATPPIQEADKVYYNPDTDTLILQKGECSCQPRTPSYLTPRPPTDKEKLMLRAWEIFGELSVEHYRSGMEDLDDSDLKELHRRALRQAKREVQSEGQLPRDSMSEGEREAVSKAYAEALDVTDQSIRDNMQQDTS